MRLSSAVFLSLALSSSRAATFKPKLDDEPPSKTSSGGKAGLDDVGVVKASDVVAPSEAKEETGIPEEGEDKQRLYIEYEDKKHHDGVLTLLHSFESLGFPKVEVHYDFADDRTIVATLSQAEKELLEKDEIIVNMEEDFMREVDVVKDYHKTNRRELAVSPQDASRHQVIPYGIWMVEAPRAWAAGATGSGVSVCVVDTGVDDSHEDLPSVSGEDFYSSYYGYLNYNVDTHGHGTHVAGTVGAGLNGIGVVGVAPDAQVYAVKVSTYGYIYSSDGVNGAKKCHDSGADVINMSFSGYSYSYYEQQLLSGIANDGTILVASAGNTGYTSCRYPACYDEVTAVASVDRTKTVASSSTRNNKVDLAAPGVNVLSTVPMGGDCSVCYSRENYDVLSGTSMAAPHVAGVAALLKSRFPSATAAEIINAMYESAMDLGDPGYDNLYGEGLVQAMRALAVLNGGTPLETDNGCGENEMALNVTLWTDRYGNETSWLLSQGDMQIPVVLQNEFESSSQYSYFHCLSEDLYNLTFYDSHGDGICCDFEEGDFSVEVDGLELASPRDAAFKTAMSYAFGVSSNEMKENKPICLDPTSGVGLRVKLNTDEYPDELSVALFKDDESDDELVWELDVVDSFYEYTKSTCLDDTGCYALKVEDLYGDGVCCNHGYGDISVELENEEIYSGSQFGKGTIIRFGDGCECMNATLVGRADWDYNAEAELIDNDEAANVWDLKMVRYQNFEATADCLDPTHCYEFVFRDGDKNGFSYSSAYMEFAVDGEVLADESSLESIVHVEFGNCGN